MNPQIKTLVYPAIFVAFILIFFLGRSCAKPDSIKIQNAELIKKQIIAEKTQEKKIRTEAIRKDSIVHHWHTVYKSVRKDSLLPCPEKLVIADTVIWQDSSLIYSLKQDISKLDTIIGLQDKVILNDSLSIIGLKKEVKRQKRQKILIAGLAIVFGGIAIVK